MPVPLAARRFLLFSGDENWCCAQAKALLAPLPRAECVWLGEGGSQDEQSLNPNTANKLLGQEKSAVVINAYSGLSPNTFAALCGTIKAGGALILLTPPLVDWPSYPDPEMQKIAPYPLGIEDVSGHYLERWVRILKSDEQVEHYAQRTVENVAPIQAQSANNDAIHQALNDEQQQAIEAVIKVVTGQRKRPTLLMADRGRGKSAALGIAIGTLLQQKQVQRIAVVGGQAQSISTVFKHAAAVLGLPFSDDARRLSTPDGGTVVQSTVDALRSTKNSSKTDEVIYDLVVIDEAATIGVAQLNQLLQNHSRLAFASTVHGYEGSGRGFSLKFTRSLKKHSRGTRQITLQAPVRWAKGDPLERITDDLLLLKAQPPQLAYASSAIITYQTIEAQQWPQDEILLNEVVGLLAAAHYQTRPSDVRHLLDGPAHRLLLQYADGMLCGALWLSDEGGFNLEMAEAICFGYRRPQGHLLPEVLAAQLGLAKGAQLHTTRVQRIAIHPSVQRQGLGRALLKQAEMQLKAQVDLFASSFGADEPLLCFWQACDYQVVRLSQRAGLASGLHSAVVIKPLSAPGKTVFKSARAAFGSQLIGTLDRALRNLPWPLVMHLLAPADVKLSADEHEQLAYFALGHKPYESSEDGLHRSCLALISSSVWANLEPTAQAVWVTKVLQGRSWASSVAIADLDSRKAAEQVLRASVRTYLQHAQPAKWWQHKLQASGKKTN